MINSGMMICSFNLKKSYSKGTDKIINLNHRYDAIQEDDTVVSYSDIFDMIKSFCEQNKNNINDEKKMKTFSIKDDTIEMTETDTYRSLAFTVVSGAYGIESDMTDSTTDTVLFHRDVHVADNKKFNILVFVPKDQGKLTVFKGIIIFQTIGTYGVKSLTVKKMKAFFSAIGLTFDTRSVSVRALVEKLIDQGNMYKITLIKENASRNQSDNMLISRGVEERSFIKPILQPLWKQKMLLFFEAMDKTGMYEIGGDEFEDIKVQFKLGDRVRTASLRNIDKFSVVEDFPETIFIDGHYDRDALINYMIDTAEAYKEKMVFTVDTEG